jgi:hypothetical protein
MISFLCSKKPFINTRTVVIWNASYFHSTCSYRYCRYGFVEVFLVAQIPTVGVWSGRFDTRAAVTKSGARSGLVIPGPGR